MPDIPENIIIIISLSLFMLLIIAFIVVFIVLYQKRHKKYIEEKTALENNFHQALLQAQLEIQEQTLQNISQEVHDNIGQVLSLAKMYLGTMYTASTEQLHAKLDDTRGLVGKAIQDLRDLSKMLHTGYVTEMGLLRSVEYELEMLRKTGTIEAVAEVEGTPYKSDARKELILFRIIQEVIHNVIKHAEAGRITVLFNYQPAYLSVTLTDNGKGFDMTLLNTNENTKFGLGLRNMQNRAHLIGAEFSLSSIPGNGTTVTLILPC
ncbi:MAG: ATP-binding protein [Chitinophagaceae bacterium]